MRLLYIHAHFDDYEFTAAGTFDLWKRKGGDQCHTKLIVCTDGAAGHHFRSREETGRLRLSEQEESARLGGYEFELLRLPDGQVPRETSLQSTPPLLAALWKAIRDFEPDYLFCPPLPSDTLSGIHLDHAAVADAVRKVAYMINVPHAFTTEFPHLGSEAQFIKTPVILNVFDGYQFGENSYDLAVNIEGVFARVCEMSYCHRSQIMEWLPWVGRHEMKAPHSLDEWSKQMRARTLKRNTSLGIKLPIPTEVFTVTAWGTVPSLKQLTDDFPNLIPEICQFKNLEQKLSRWGEV